LGSSLRRRASPASGLPQRSAGTGGAPSGEVPQDLGGVPGAGGGPGRASWGSRDGGVSRRLLRRAGGYRGGGGSEGSRAGSAAGPSGHARGAFELVEVLLGPGERPGPQARRARRASRTLHWGTRVRAGFGPGPLKSPPRTRRAGLRLPRRQPRTRPGPVSFPRRARADGRGAFARGGERRGARGAIICVPDTGDGLEVKVLCSLGGGKCQPIPMVKPQRPTGSCRRQTLGPTNRNRVRRSRADELARQREVRRIMSEMV
jgi:hypothetical protein